MSADRIASVLRIRRLQERRERAEVAARRRTHRVALTAESTAWQAVSDRRLPSTPLPVRELHGHHAVLEGGIGVARRRGETTVIAAHEVEIQVDSWSVAARRVEGLERLDERLRTAERAEAERREAVEVDDLVLARRAHTRNEP
ncbi:MAG: hypothetical protein AB7Q42_16250 [Acidimicrobiia bacterium]